MDEKKKIAIVWLNNDLRTHDNAALDMAVECHEIIIPVYIFDPTGKYFKPMGHASRWWLYQSLRKTIENFKEIGLPLFICEGQTIGVLKKLIEQYNADGLYYNVSVDKHTPFFNKALSTIECEQHRFYDSQFLFHPSDVHPNNGEYFKVFGAFYRACHLCGMPENPIMPPPKQTVSLSIKAPSFAVSLEDSQILPDHRDWSQKFEEMWSPGEKAALSKLEEYCSNKVVFYEKQRDFPCLDSTSHFSPHLHFGELSMKTVWHRLLATLHEHRENTQYEENIRSFMRQLLWREFYGHLLYHNPDLQDEPMNPKFSKFSWRKADDTLLQAWKEGKTGYPIIDAGMRQLHQSGWMHNRVRMIAASFFVKHLRFDWKLGEEYFWDALVDADLANNNGGWQWVAGCGADAAPYFRIFNPILQSQKFDTQGIYIKQWVPELAKLSNKYIHTPWTAPKEELAKAGIILGKDYPMPIIDHNLAREQALDAYHGLKE